MMSALAGDKAPSEGFVISGRWLSLVEGSHADVQVKLVFFVLARLDVSQFHGSALSFGTPSTREYKRLCTSALHASGSLPMKKLVPSDSTIPAPSIYVNLGSRTSCAIQFSDVFEKG
jgi:hypothetical protein